MKKSTHLTKTAPSPGRARGLSRARPSRGGLAQTSNGSSSGQSNIVPGVSNTTLMIGGGVAVLGIGALWLMSGSSGSKLPKRA